MIIFKYKKEVTDYPEKYVYRPVANVSIQKLDGEWIQFHPYIDSGADVSLIPLSLGKLLGLRSDSKQIKEVSGIRGNVPVIYCTRNIKIGNLVFPAEIAWVLIEEVPPLLGRKNIFDRFNITFKQKQRIIEFA